MECTEIEFPHEPYFLASLSTFHSPYISSDFLIQYLSMYLSVLADIGGGGGSIGTTIYCRAFLREAPLAPLLREASSSSTGFEELLSDSFSSMLFSCSKGKKEPFVALETPRRPTTLTFLPFNLLFSVLLVMVFLVNYWELIFIKLCQNFTTRSLKLSTI